jgi:hypothetical protein
MSITLSQMSITLSQILGGAEWKSHQNERNGILVIYSCSTISAIRTDELMPHPAADPRVDSSRPPPQPSRRKTTRKTLHSWTDEELNLLSHLRYLRRWPFKQIQRSHFPSLSPSALLGAYWRLSTEDRVRRASMVTIPITTLRNTKRDRRSASHPQPTCPSLEQGPNHLHSHISRPLSQSGSSAEASISSSSSCETGDRPVISGDGNTKRYNLRPNRPTTFLEGKPRYLVDHLRFPHFFESYNYHLKRHGLPDSDYAPPSHTPTPDPSDGSPSVVSSQLSPASDSELFGLEPRSPNLSDRRPSVSPGRLSNTPNPEFFSCEEHLPSP